MPLPEPILDDLRFQRDLVDEAKRRIIRYCPEWTDYNVSDRWAVGATVAYASNQYAHGDENNQDAHGRVPGYTVANLETEFQLAKNLQLFANITNLFDRRYQNFGLLGAKKSRLPATARKIAERFWRLLTNGTAYVRQGMDEYEKNYHVKLTRRLAQRAGELGYKLVPLTLEPEPEPQP